MARYNNASLYGQVIEDPKYDEINGEPRIRCGINILRGKRDIGDSIDDLQYDSPVIMTMDAKIIEEMKNWHENDMVEVKGVVCTKNINKRVTCPFCGTVKSYKGVVSYISPIHVMLIEHAKSDEFPNGLTKEEGLKKLRENCEISNQVQMIGNLCVDPDAYHFKSGSVVCQYQIAVNRKYRIKEDQVETRVDYPWIRSFGKIAASDERHLKTGASVLLDGMLATREVVRENVCENEKCGRAYKWKYSVMEIIPYSVEYLQNYITDEEIAKNEAKKIDTIKKSLGNNDD